MLTFLNVINDEKNKSKLEVIYLHYHRDLLLAAYAILKDYHEAEDVVQSAILKLANNLDKITDIQCKKTRAYLVIIVRNLAFDIYNKKKKVSAIPFEQINILTNEDEVSLDDHLLRMDESKEMAKKLNKTYPPYADILTLRYYYQLSNSEIAETLDISENNVSVRIHRALKALKKCLEKGDTLDEQSI